MRRLSLFFAIFVFFLLSVVSCYYDNEEALYPAFGTACDTADVTFSTTIVPVLNNNCLSCHSNTTAAGSGNNIRLEDYADVKARVVAVTGSIKHTGSYFPMPKNGGKIKACSITQFDIWVRIGMPNK